MSDPTLAACDERYQRALSPREREVLHFLARGLERKQIALRLATSEHTVRAQCLTLYAKLGAVNAAHAVYLAMRAGLLNAQGDP